ncbi:MAG: L-serine ammonia-lyase, iron-sulfur-dependent, subunit alpha [Spirochaetaceae bacterium]|jgi:L-serine dehydratase|nr:L-serine ammonia-lyase, iron-sulfur-dependent, subunit alpha [Spirochaetaceae bacterium]GMO26956.1 MAG: L-serine ammonia-lyase, iron-sulfur-dependent, subunit alpha [Termitinemataceae bacterium]
MELLEYNSIGALVKTAEAESISLSKLILRDQAAALEKSEDELFAQMTRYYGIMRESAEKGMAKELRSSSGLSGGGGWLLLRHAGGNPISGSFCAKALARAVAIAEYNASMGKIVAAPTAGSCGILPAAVITMQEERGIDDEAAVLSLWTAGGFGMVIARQASISGAEGGCQAECGSAAAIAAAALTELSGGVPAQCAQAAALAITNSLGLVCDPIGGLVEVPCVARNAGGIMNAIGAAELAVAGFSLPIPIDEVIDTMRDVGAAIPGSLRETAAGGLAVTPTACALCSNHR